MRFLTAACMGAALLCADNLAFAEVSNSSAARSKVPQPALDYALFETLQVRPLALSPDGQLLYALNTPDNRLEVFDVQGRDGTPRQVASVSVGLEPVALAVRNAHEVWVVNHLSDSVSVVHIDTADDQHGRSPHSVCSARVVRTLLVGDEPRDIVFAGPKHSLAFVTTAHRGQNIGADPQPFEPSVGRADVWVFDADNLGTSLAGTSLQKLTLFADTPRALAASPDGSRVYAAPFYSGNLTTIASKEAVAKAYAEDVDPKNPFFFFYRGSRQPLTSRVVKGKLAADGTYHFYDDLGTDFSKDVRVSLPDYDVFTIDATSNPPSAIANKTFAHVGTTLFNMAVHPHSGKVYVTNTDAHNDVRFEGHNPNLDVTSVRGHLVDSRISVIDPANGNIVHNDLNSHIVNGVGNPRLSRAFPQDLVFSADGSRLFAVAQGSAKLVIYDSASLENGTATPTTSNQVSLSAGGPTGVVVDASERRAYVLTRFDNGISIVDLRARREARHVRMFSPEPKSVSDGRRFLYDATYTSETGTQACASCHIGGDMDHLAWDLGNPGGIPLPITRAGGDDVLFTAAPAVISAAVPNAADLFTAFLPLKGPMTTQSLRGLDNHGSMHWRGDRNGAVRQDGTPALDNNGNPVVSAQPNAGMFDEFAAFSSFNVAFPGLVGRSAQLTADEMAAFTRFALQITYPPNPYRNLDNTLTPQQQIGSDFYHQTFQKPDGTSQELPVDRLHNCNGCHTLDPDGNRGATDHPGFYGTRGRLSFENLTQLFKVAHLRNVYQKIGMFASSPDSNRTFTPSPILNPPLTAVRGFGFQPDGAVGRIQHHLSGAVFVKVTNPNDPAGPNPGGIPTFKLDAQGEPIADPDPAGFPLRDALASFLIAYDSNFKPILGQQVSYDARTGADVDQRIALLISRSDAGECGLVGKAYWDGSEHGFVYVQGMFRSSRWSDSPISLDALKRLVRKQGSTLTLTCVPPSSAYRIGVDRDADGIADADDDTTGH